MWRFKWKRIICMFPFLKSSTFTRQHCFRNVAFSPFPWRRRQAFVKTSHLEDFNFWGEFSVALQSLLHTLQTRPPSGCSGFIRNHTPWETCAKSNMKFTPWSEVETFKRIMWNTSQAKRKTSNFQCKIFSFLSVEEEPCCCWLCST